MLPVLLPDDALAVADRPLLTYCDDVTGERVELTASALGGWAARTAGLLRVGCGLAAGDRATACANLDRANLDERVAAEGITRVL